MPTIEQARQWYPQDDPVHGFDHVLRVLHIAEQLARQEGADIQIVQAAALLHDAEGASAIDPETREDHHLDAAEFARRVLVEEGWSTEQIAAVQHCIRAHRFRDDSVQPKSLEARILFDADKLDAIGAIGAARAIAYAAGHNQPAYRPPSEHFLATGEKEPDEGHSAYHEYLFKLCKLKDRLYTAPARKIAEERHQYLAGFFERLVQELNGEA